MSEPVAPSRVRGAAIITGAGQGLGRAFAQAFAGIGSPVGVADINLGSAERVAEEINEAGGRAVAVRVDVTDEGSVESMTAEMERALGPIGVLVNNAALFSALEMRPFAEVQVAEWRRVLDVNVVGAFLCARAAIPRMAQRQYGKVINISSATVWTGRPGYLHYVTSKAALIGFTRALAAEVGPSGIRVNAITPGSTQTEIERATITPEARRAMAEATALRRVQVPGDLIGALLFLASGESDFITGQTINVDGGFAFH